MGNATSKEDIERYNHFILKVFDQLKENSSRDYLILDELLQTRPKKTHKNHPKIQLDDKKVNNTTISTTTSTSTSTTPYLEIEKNMMENNNTNPIEIETKVNLPINFCHFGILFIAIGSHSGKIYLKDMFDFSLLCHQFQQLYDISEFPSELRAFSILHMLHYVEKQNSIEDLLSWFMQLIVVNAKTQQKEMKKENSVFLKNNVAFLSKNQESQKKPVKLKEWNSFYLIRNGIEYCGRSTASTIHSLFHLEKYHSLSFEEFFDLLQQTGEEMELLDIQNETFDDLVPVPVIQHFTHSFIQGFLQMMKELQLALPNKITPK